MFFQGSIGVDITSERVNIIYLRSLMNRSTIFASKSHEFGENLPIDKRIYSVAEWISSFIMEYKAEVAEVHIGIPGDLCITRTLSFPSAVKENISSTLFYEMDKYIPIPVDDIHYDYQIISEDKVNRTLTLLLMIVKKKDLSPYLELKHLVHRGVSSIGTRPGGLINYLGKINILADHSWYWVIHPVENERCELNGVENQSLKYSRIVHYKDLQEKTFYEELLQSGDFLGRPPTPVTLFVLDEMLFNHLNTCCDGWEEVNLTYLDLSADSLLPDPSYASTYGLALKGQETVPMEINFLPQAYRKKPSRMAFYTMIVLSVVLLISIAALGGGYVMRKNQMLNKIDSELATVANDVFTISQMKAEIDILEKRVLVLEKIAKGTIPVSVIMRDLSQRLPKSAWLKNLEISNNGVKLTGMAGKASDLISILEQSPYLKDAAFLSTLVKNNDNLDSFQIGVKLDASGYP